VKCKQKYERGKGGCWLIHSPLPTKLTPQHANSYFENIHDIRAKGKKKNVAHMKTLCLQFCLYYLHVFFVRLLEKEKIFTFFNLEGYLEFLAKSKSALLLPEFIFLLIYISVFLLLFNF